jgi:flagellar basal body L-ring protein FlgH
LAKKILEALQIKRQSYQLEFGGYAQGSGNDDTRGNSTATITAIVKEVLPNGNLVIQGTRTVAVNHEEQYITITRDPPST